MRALAVAAVLALAGCGGGAGGGGGGGSAGMMPPTTGLVLTLRFNRDGVDLLELSGATTVTARKFGPYTIAESALPHDGTVGFVFDAADAGSVMVCGESHDGNGHTLQEGCDMFDIVAGQVTQGSLTLTN